MWCHVVTQFQLWFKKHMSDWVLKRKYQCSRSQGETAEGRRVCEDFYLQQGQRRSRKDEEELHIPSGSQHGLSYKKKTNPDQFLAVINSLFFKSCELCLRMKNHDSKSNCKPSNSSWNEALKKQIARLSQNANSHFIWLLSVFTHGRLRRWMSGSHTFHHRRCAWNLHPDPRRLYVNSDCT